MLLQELVFTTRRVGANEALSLRLVNHCVEEGKAMGRALELARDIAQVGCASRQLKFAGIVTPNKTTAGLAWAKGVRKRWQVAAMCCLPTADF